MGMTGGGRGGLAGLLGGGGALCLLGWVDGAGGRPRGAGAGGACGVGCPLNFALRLACAESLRANVLEVRTQRRRALTAD